MLNKLFPTFLVRKLLWRRGQFNYFGTISTGLFVWISLRLYGRLGKASQEGGYYIKSREAEKAFDLHADKPLSEVSEHRGDNVITYYKRVEGLPWWRPIRRREREEKNRGLRTYAKNHYGFGTEEQRATIEKLEAF